MTKFKSPKTAPSSRHLSLLRIASTVTLVTFTHGFAFTTRTRTNKYADHHILLPKNTPLKQSRSHTAPLSAATTFDGDLPTPPFSATVVKNDPFTQTATDTKIGVLLLNLGGPEKGDDVEGFLYNLFADPDIIRLPPPLAPLQNLIALGISKRRAPKSREAYNSIGGGSPILSYSKAQASLLRKSLSEKHGITAKTYIAMRYWQPYTKEALDKIRSDGIEALVIIPLYPQFSISTSGSSLRVLAEEFAKEIATVESGKEEGMVHTVVPSWYDRPGYVNCMATLVTRELDSYTEEELTKGGRHVLFSAHGVPRSYIEAGDPYKTQIEECVKKIEAFLPEDVTVHLSYQSRVGPIEWLRPYTDDVLPELGEKGVKNLVVVPISFVSEHVETLEEIDIEYRELAEESGIENWKRCPAPNTDAGFIDDMAEMVVDALMEPVQTVTEACISNNVENVGVEVDTTGLMAASKSKEVEKLNGRVAMAGVAVTLIVELLSGKSLLHMFGL